MEASTLSIPTPEQLAHQASARDVLGAFWRHTGQSGKVRAQGRAEPRQSDLTVVVGAAATKIRQRGSEISAPAPIIQAVSIVLSGLPNAVGRGVGIRRGAVLITAVVFVRGIAGVSLLIAFHLGAAGHQCPQHNKSVAGENRTPQRPCPSTRRYAGGSQ